ncbi:MAG: glucosaminidase domain-containing protein [Bacilli bacterium]|nr:glucosaminidase domain-containing protein [Bacilli bacterium]
MDKKTNNQGYKSVNNANSKPDRNRQQADQGLDSAKNQSQQDRDFSKNTNKRNNNKGFNSTNKSNNTIGNNHGNQQPNGMGNSNPNRQPNGQNKGKALLNGMKKAAKPDSNNVNGDNKKLQRAAKLAKHAPIPQVKAAGKAVEAMQKSKIGKSLSKMFGGKGGGLLGAGGSPEQMIIAAIRRKLIMLMLPVLGVLLIVMLLMSLFTSSSTVAASQTNEGLCLYDRDELIEKGIKKEILDDCNNADSDAKNYYSRAKSSDLESVDIYAPLYIEGFYLVVSQNKKADLDYDDMSSDVIGLLKDKMQKDDELDESTFRKNLVKDIIPAYIEGKKKDYYNSMVNRIFKYVEDMKKMYNLDDEDSDDDSCIGPVTKLTAKELCKLNKAGKTKEWVEKFGPVAQQDYARTGVFASVTMAQAILESGWACSDIQNNIFGIKCNGAKKCTTVLTHEYVNGQYVAVNDSFRIYKNIGESIYDHSKFLKDNSRYSQAGVFSAKNATEQAHALQKAGYATSPTYATSLINNFIKPYNLTKFDKKVNTPSDASCTTSSDSLAGWSIRTVKPTSKDKAFTYKNSNRGQCVWYAQARAIEIAEDLAKKKKITDAQAKKIKDKLLSIYGDAGQWYNVSKGKFKRSNKVKDVKAGSIISWTQNGKWGHVAVIENVTKKQVTITEGWANHVQSCPNSWGCINFRSKTMSKNEFLNSYAKYYVAGRGYKFSGYIYFLEPES